MGKMHKILVGLGLVASLGACDKSGTTEPMMTTPTPTPTPTAPSDNVGVSSQVEAFDHDDTVPDPFADGNQVPAAVGERMHACGKMLYSHLGNILSSRGVNLTTATDPASAGVLYNTGNVVLGVANFGARVPEALHNTTGGMTRLFDTLIAAADEFIANLPTQQACMVNGVGATLFNADNSCNADGFSCILGVTVTSAQLQQCNDMIKDFGTDVADGKRLAVAAMITPTFLCE